VNVSELTGALLDGYVAKALGAYRGPYQMVKDGRPEEDCLIFPGDFPCSATTGDFNPSTDWAHGGPINEREKIATRPKAKNTPTETGWVAIPRDDVLGGQRGIACDGPTPLIAAMRAYVASKFGDTVPEEPA